MSSAPGVVQAQARARARVGKAQRERETGQGASEEAGGGAGDAEGAGDSTAGAGSGSGVSDFSAGAEAGVSVAPALLSASVHLHGAPQQATRGRWEPLLREGAEGVGEAVCTGSATGISAAREAGAGARAIGSVRPPAEGMWNQPQPQR